MLQYDPYNVQSTHVTYDMMYDIHFWT